MSSLIPYTPSPYCRVQFIFSIYALGSIQYSVFRTTDPAAPFIQVDMRTKAVYLHHPQEFFKFENLRKKMRYQFQ